MGLMPCYKHVDDRQAAGERTIDKTLLPGLEFKTRFFYIIDNEEYKDV